MHIYNNRDNFYQWDLNQKLTDQNFKIGEKYHIYNTGGSEVCIVQAYEYNGSIVIDVPNILLQKAFPIIVYKCMEDENSFCTYEKYEFSVKQRPKPSDYVYTETEVLTYKKLEEKLDQMQGLIGDLTNLETESKDNLVDAINKTKYTLPPMTGTALGGAMADPAQESDTQPVRIGADHKLYTAPGGGGSGGSGGEYILPIATAEKLGGVKPVTKTESMTQSVGVDSEGRLFTAEALDDVLCVNLSMGKGGTITADKTFAEITKAAGSGMCVIARLLSGETLYLLRYDDTSASFLMSDGIENVYIYCDSSDTWTFDPYTLTASDVGAIPSPTTAAVGQTVVVKAVDGNGVPTEWGTADMPSGGGSSGALAGLTIADNYDIELISHVIIDQGNIPTAGITVTQKDNGSAFAYDGLLIWSDAKSSGAYTTFNFNGYTNYPLEFTHGNAKFLNLYITDGVTMSIQNGGIVRHVIKQSYADTGSQFFPEIAFQRVPEKFTSFKIGADGIASVTFYKAWGLTRK